MGPRYGPPNPPALVAPRQSRGPPRSLLRWGAPTWPPKPPTAPRARDGDQLQQRREPRAHPPAHGGGGRQLLLVRSGDVRVDVELVGHGRENVEVAERDAAADERLEGGLAAESAPLRARRQPHLDADRDL